MPDSYHFHTRTRTNKSLTPSLNTKKFTFTWGCSTTELLKPRIKQTKLQKFLLIWFEASRASLQGIRLARRGESKSTEDSGLLLFSFSCVFNRVFVWQVGAQLEFRTRARTLSFSSSLYSGSRNNWFVTGTRARGKKSISKWMIQVRRFHPSISFVVEVFLKQTKTACRFPRRDPLLSQQILYVNSH